MTLKQNLINPSTRWTAIALITAALIAAVGAAFAFTATSLIGQEGSPGPVAAWATGLIIVGSTGCLLFSIILSRSKPAP